ncbi:replication initiator protein A [Deinococcus yunweiensis]|uniref:replication initiator protein A n=1 Tax=Deinococcus yunweiensis TaxID=367282 RepID=UPI00398F56BD
MTRARRKPMVAPKLFSEIDRYDEANSARLGLICIQERIPSGYTRWDREYNLDGRDARLTCISPGEYGGVPHGLDGDFATLLNVLYLEQGSPESGEVHTTAYQLIQRAGFPDSGQYYQSLQESLDRLKGATYTASESWRDHRQKRWTTVKFNIIEQIDSDTEGGTAFGVGTTLKIRLARPVVQSLRERYVKPLDLTFVMSLKRSLTRSLYRMLDAHRYDPANPQEPAAALRLPLLQWARECKLVEEVPARVRRNLESAHAELIDRGYLKSVTYEGRRAETIIVYEFGDLPATAPAPEPMIEVVPDSPVTEALRRRGVAHPVARRLVADFGENHVTVRLETFEAMIAAGYKARNPSALLVDVIKDQEGKYAALGTSALPAAVAPHARISKVVGDEDVDALSATLDTEFRALPPAEQAARAVTSVRMFIGKELREGHYRSLLRAVQAGDVDALELQREATRAAAELRLPEFAEGLRRAYSEP